MAGRTGYAQLSNGLWLNDKANELMDADPRAFGMWVMSLSYASDNMTDGVLNARALRRLGCDDRTRDALIECGMWEATGDGCVRIHDYVRPPIKKHSIPRKHIPDSLRRKIYRRDGYQCVRCGSTDHLSLDHIWPWSLGGKDLEQNLQTLCRSCNSRKGANPNG